MNEINLNALAGSMGIGRSLDSVANQKNIPVKRPSIASDSAEFSQLPDFSAAEKSIEDDFADLRSRLQGAADSELYPPLETIDKLAAMLAMDLDADIGKSPSRE